MQTWVSLGTRLQEAILTRVPDLAHGNDSFEFWQKLDAFFVAVRGENLCELHYLGLLSLLFGWPVRVITDLTEARVRIRQSLREDVRCPEITLWLYNECVGGVTHTRLPCLFITEEDLGGVDLVDVVSS